jgi:hypothetical protein
VIGPGWMPSRPRPLSRPRGGPLYWLCLRDAVRRRRPRRDGASRCDDDGACDQASACNTRRVLFDGPRIKLPVATLLATGSQTRRRMDLDRWLSLRWEWVRPRAVPLFAAFVGLLLSLGAVKYTSKLSYTPDQARPSLVRAVRAAPAEAAPEPRARLPQIYQGLECEGTECFQRRAECPHRAR